MVASDDAIDLAPLQRVVDRWWPQAVLCANPEIQAGVNVDRARIAAGDPTVFGETTTYMWMNRIPSEIKAALRPDSD
ncbi:DUF6247 family protein [Protofrankia symbiont of Coriaria ruscifolia]|uniref:DUF6247 family protein n=1 Tax=Protofrankia symbiont of Coriaria ruscifolia TaxID=1306542 RepID=UPI001F5E6FAD|nr:DUF6247 family protein [Protofrankia symbiont of Coriaria ruscifolia]